MKIRVLNNSIAVPEYFVENYFYDVVIEERKPLCYCALVEILTDENVQLFARGYFCIEDTEIFYLRINGGIDEEYGAYYHFDENWYNYDRLRWSGFEDEDEDEETADDSFEMTWEDYVDEVEREAEREAERNRNGFCKEDVMSILTGITPTNNARRELNTFVD